MFKILYKMHEYSNSDTLLLKEYGRNIQKLVEYVQTIEDRNERTRKAYLIVEMMKQIHPNYKEVQDIPSKFWDDLFIISHFQLDVDSPFPMPEKDAIGKPPQKVEYSHNNIKFRHYGKNIQMLIEKVGSMPETEEKKDLELLLFRLFKAFCLSWQKENIEDNVLVEHIRLLSDGKINISPELIAQHKILRGAGNEMKNKEKQYFSNQNNKNKKNQFKKKNRNNGNKNRAK
ncbi:MAG: DUF4290 domain-containing protein [Raineya sp.]